VIATDGLVAAGAVAWLLVHLDSEGVASLGSAVPSGGLATIHIASDILQIRFQILIELGYDYENTYVGGH
jgi:hypothetical protein